MVLAELVAETITSLISWGGYQSLVLLMALESMIAPVPSEAVMPFAGFLVHEGVFSFELVAFYSTIGSIIGSLLSYYLGLFGGRRLIEKYGKFLFLNSHHLELTEAFFRKNGDKTIFIGRFIPVVRHLISIPAGVGRMDVVKFSAYTIVGAGAWNMLLAYAGFVLKDNWSEVMEYGQAIDVLVIVGIIAAVAYVLYTHRK